MMNKLITVALIQIRLSLLKIHEIGESNLTSERNRT